MLWSRAAVLPSWFPPAVPTCFSCGAAFRQQPQLQTIGETFPIRFPHCKALIISQNPTRTHLSPGCMAEAAARLHGYRANREPDSRALLPATICFLRDSLPLFLGSSCLPRREGGWWGGYLKLLCSVGPFLASLEKKDAGEVGWGDLAVLGQCSGVCVETRGIGRGG